MVDWFLQITLAVEWCHMHNVIHRSAASALGHPHVLSRRPRHTWSPEQAHGTQAVAWDVMWEVFRNTSPLPDPYPPPPPRNLRPWEGAVLRSGAMLLIQMSCVSDSGVKWFLLSLKVNGERVL